MVKSIKALRNEYKSKGVFYTPPALAIKLHDEVVAELGAEPTEVYDPTCGGGNLLRVFTDSCTKYGQDIDSETVQDIELNNFVGKSGDTLSDDGFIDSAFSAIVANPPFSVSWEADKPENIEKYSACGGVAPKSKADWAFLQHIMFKLSSNGVAVALNAPGVLYRMAREYSIRKYFCQQGYIKKIVWIEGNTFEDTSIPTVLLVLRKDRSTKEITFVVGEKQYTASYDEIEKNDFLLTPQMYIDTTPPRSSIDIKQVNRLCANRLMRETRNEVLKLMMLEREMGDEMYLDEIANCLTEISEQIRNRKK